METFPVGYLEDLGLDYEVLSKVNPKLVMASITPFGQTGPDRNYKSSDLISMAASGYMQITGDPEEPPVRLGNEQSHFAPSQYAAFAIMAALLYRDAVSGKGQYIDISVQEALMTYFIDAYPVSCWAFTQQNVIRPGLQSRVTIPFGALPAKDGWTGLIVVAPKEWDALAQWIYESTGVEEVLDPKYKGYQPVSAPYFEELIARITDFASRFSKQELFHEGQKRGVVALPVNTVEDVFKDPHLEASGFWVELDHPLVGKLKYPRGPFERGDIPPPRKAAPLLGENNEEIYFGELGFTKQELSVLRAGDII